MNFNRCLTFFFRNRNRLLKGEKSINDYEKYVAELRDQMQK